MGLRRGMTNNPHGRPAGVPNKSTSEVKTLIQQFVAANIDNLQSEYDKLKPAEKVYFLEKLLKFIIPSKVDTNINISALSDSEVELLTDQILEKFNSNSK